MRKGIKTVKSKPQCKPGKERNLKGRCVNIKTLKRIPIPLEFVELSLSSDSNPVDIFSFPIPVPLLKKTIRQKKPCKPDKERNSNGRCVKIKTAKKLKSKKLLTKKVKLPPCKVGKIRNYKGRCVKIKNVQYI